MDALRFELSSDSLTPTAVVASSLHSHSRHSFSSMQLGRVSSYPAIGSVAKTVNEIFTADELHYVPVPNSDWRIALWRYLPSSKSSLARFMSGSGFDTRILELRGAGMFSDKSCLLTKRETEKDIIQQKPAADLINVSERLENVFDGGSKIFWLKDRPSKRVEDFKKRLELIPHYNWDFDNYLEEDIPSLR